MNDLQPASPVAPRAVAAERGLQWLVSGWQLFLRAQGVWLGITLVLLVAMALMLLVIPTLGLGLLVLIPVLVGSVYVSYGAAPATLTPTPVA